MPLDAFPFDLSDIFKEVYWVDNYVTDDIKPPESVGTKFKHEEPLTEPYPMVDIYGNNSIQRNYSPNKTSFLKIVPDSNLGFISMPKSGFLGYEHRLFIKIYQALYGYTTWAELKENASVQSIINNTIAGFRTRPADDANRTTYGNAYLGSSLYYDSVIGGLALNNIKFAWLGMNDKKNIPCGAGMFRYREIINGAIVGEDQFCDPISADFIKYTVDANNVITTENITLYYHPNDNKWKDAINGSNVTGFYHHEDILPKSTGVLLEENYVFKIEAGDCTEQKLYLPQEVPVKLLFEEGLWQDAVKLKSFNDTGLFSGSTYKVDNILVENPCLEAVYTNSKYLHETSIDFTSWGEDYQFKNMSAGIKTTDATVERQIPYP